MSDNETDPTEQTELPKGRIDTQVPMELTTGDFESVRPSTDARPTAPPAPLPQGAKGPAWLALLVALALAGAAAWFLLKIHMPLEDRMTAQAEALRRAQTDAVELAAAIAPLKTRIDQLEGEIEELRVAADEEKPATQTPAPQSPPVPAPKKSK